MVDYVPIEKASPIRMPSTANLMIDSADRVVANYPSAGNFQITKKSSILNGFFTRIGTTEVVMDWGVANIITGVNDEIEITIGLSGETIILPPGFYNVAQALDYIVTEANVAFAPDFEFTIIQDGGEVVLNCKTDPGGVDQDFIFETDSPLLNQLGFTLYTPSPSKVVGEVIYPDLRLYKYLDIVSNQLTYAQDLKDSSTANEVRDVLCRWYFAWDTQPPVDAYGFPIYQGYTAFQQRRLYNPPKQIRWEPNLPIGNLGFQVYGKVPGRFSLESELLSETKFDFLMTLQVSEQ
jgi:hypothetical protein